MKSDLDVLRVLEAAVGRNIPLLPPIEPDKWRFPQTGYRVDEEENVIELVLYDLKLSSLPAAIGQLQSLQTVDLSKNQLSSLPAAIGQLQSLQTVDLSKNQLSSLPAAIGQLQGLQTLDMSKNQLSSLPAEIFQLQSLQRLYLSENHLSSLPAAVGQLQSLQTLYLISSQLSSLPAEIFQLQSLQTLSLISNQLSSLPAAIGQLQSLHTLYLGENQLSILPAAIGQLQSLHMLDLRSNQLSSLPAEIGQLQSLHTLGLSKNQLSSLPAEIGQLQSLHTLGLSENQLSSLPAAIGQLQSLHMLDLRSNQLSILPVEIADLELDWLLGDRAFGPGLHFYDNPLESPALEIVQQGRKAVRAYFRDLTEKVPLKEVKVLLVGDGAVGKTSLVKRIIGDPRAPFDLQESTTHGINIRNWAVEDREITVRFWDFGGQEIMHATHQFFLSKRSVYILVLDSRKDNRAEDWLKTIQSFGGNSPVLVVLNKIDENPGFDVDRLFLQEKYSGIVGFHRVSCKKRTGISQFRQALKKSLEKVELLRTPWPKSWFKVKQRLETMTEPYIDFDRYGEICEEEKVPMDSRKVLVEFLFDLGVVVHFSEVYLREVYVLNPKWVTEGVYTVLNSEVLAEANGALDPECLSDLLNVEVYPQKIHRYLIDLMKKFELCYDLDDGRILIPDLLGVASKKFELGQEEPLRFRVKYGFLPRSVMPRLIVKIHRDICEDSAWRTGVILHSERFGASARVRCDYTERTISMEVTGPRRRDYFAAILYFLRDINEDFESLEEIEEIALPDNPSVTVSYDHLLFLEGQGLKDFVPPGAKKFYSVSELLGSIQNEDSTEDQILEIVKEILNIMNSPEEPTLDDWLELKPNLAGIGINLNKLIELWQKKKL